MVSAAWLSRADGCPECVQNVELPHVARPDPLGVGFLAHYVCADCGHAWKTGWAE